MTRETEVLSFNGNKYRGTVQDSHPLDGWLVEIVVLDLNTGWWKYLGKGRFHVGEILDWEWGDTWVANSNGQITKKSPLHHQFKDQMERAIVKRCMDLLQKD